MITQMTLAGYTIHTDSSTAQAHLRELPVTLFGSPAARDSRTAKPDDHGVIDQTRYYEPRIIDLAGKIAGTSWSDIYSTLNQIQARLRPGSLSELRWTLADGSDRRCYVRPISEFAINTTGKAPRIYWDCQVIAPDPRIYGGTARTADLEPTADATAGLEFPLTFPLNFFGASGPTVTVNNAGTDGGRPTFLFTGPWTGAWVRNTTTDQTLYLRSTLQLEDGDEVEVNTELGTVTLNGVADPSVVDWSRSDVPELAPGDNVFTPGGAYFAGASVLISGFDTWI